MQASPGKLDRLPRSPAGSTALALDGCGLRDSLPARPTRNASYPVSVRQVAGLLHASFKRHLAMRPLRFAGPSPPSGWTGDFHPQAIEHAGHTANPLSRESAALGLEPRIIDPTRLAQTAGLVRIGVGCDAADTAFAAIWGETLLKAKTVTAEAADDDALLPDDESGIGTS